jgi:hypothetical protein
VETEIQVISQQVKKNYPSITNFLDNQNSIDKKLIIDKIKLNFKAKNK